MNTYQIISTILNLVLGGSLITSLFTLSQTRKKMSADVHKQQLDNAEHASQILMNNIVKPLKAELINVRRELTKFKNAIEKISDCDYAADCPVRNQLQESTKDTSTDQ